MFKGIFLLKLPFLVLPFFSIAVMAGPRITGNGGDVVVCRSAKGAIKSVELLDFFEESTIRSNPIDLLPAGTVEQNFNALVERLDPYNSGTLKSQYAGFFAEALFLSNVDLVDIPDSQHTVLPKDCKIEQIAIQAKPTTANPKRYTVSKDLWDRLDAAGKAGLVLHELLYRRLDEYSYAEELNSIPVRYLNGTLASQHYAKLDLSAQLEALAAVGIRYIQLKNFVAEISSIRFDKTGKISSYGILVPKGSTIFITPSFSLKFRDESDTIAVAAELGGDVGDIRKLNFRHNDYLPPQKLLSNSYFDLSIGAAKNFGVPNSFSFDGKGLVTLIEGPSQLDLKLTKLSQKCQKVFLVNAELNCEFAAGNYFQQAWVVKDQGALSHITYTLDRPSYPRAINFEEDYLPNGLLQRVTYFKHMNYPYPGPGTASFANGACNYPNDIRNLDGSFVGQNLSFGNACFRLMLNENESAVFKDGRYIKGGWYDNWGPIYISLKEFTGASVLWNQKNLLEFYEDGRVKEATFVLRKDAHGDTIPLVLDDVKGNKVSVSSFMHVEFDQNGRVVRVTEPLP